MTDLIFKDPEEAAAWDMYVAAVIAHPEMYEDSDAMSLADAMLIERRKRMAPAESKPEREWLVHKPGDPMPCDGETLVEVKMGNENYQSPTILASHAKKFNWTFVNDLMSDRSSYHIIAWRPA